MFVFCLAQFPLADSSCLHLLFFFFTFAFTLLVIANAFPDGDALFKLDTLFRCAKICTEMVCRELKVLI